MSENVSETSDSNFDNDVLKSQIPVLVDFWAPWCGPCKAIAPVLEEIASQFAGKIKIVKLNVDDNPRIPAQFSIRAIPTLIIFKNGTPLEVNVEGEKVSKIQGSRPKEILVSAINQAV